MTKYILMASEIEDMEGVQKTHFLNEKAKRLNKSLGDATGLTGLGVHLIEVQPGDETTQHHVHYFEDECIYVLSGTATSVLGDDEVEEIGPGDFIGYPKRGLAHSIINTGTDVFRCLVIGERLSNDVADYPKIRKRIYRNANMPYDLVNLDDIVTPGGSVGKK